MSEPGYPEPVDDPYFTAVLPIIEKPNCDCEWVDIGVGMQRVTDEPTCPKHSAFGLASAVLGALYEAGLLVPTDGQRVDDWRVIYRDGRHMPVVWSEHVTRESGEKGLANAKREGWPNPELQHRTAISTSWIKVQS